MDRHFQVHANTFLSERHSHIIVKCRKENENISEIKKNIDTSQEQLKSQVTEETWRLIKRLIDLLNLQSHAESKYLYVQGAKDCIYLAHFVEMECLSTSINDL